MDALTLAKRAALLAIAMQIADTSVPVIRLSSWVDYYDSLIHYDTTTFLLAESIKNSLVSYGIPIRAGYV